MAVGAEGEATADDGTAADAARAADDVEQVVGVAAGTEGALGAQREGRGIGRLHGNSEGCGHLGGEGLLRPAEVGGLAHEPVGQAHLPGHGDAGSEDAPRNLGVTRHPGDDGARGLHDLVDADGSAPGDAGPSEHPTAEADETDVERVDLGVHGDGDGGGIGDDDAARAAGAGHDGRTLAHQPECDEIADDDADRRAVEAGEAREFGARVGAVAVQPAEEAREVAVADVLRGTAARSKRARGLGDGRHGNDPTHDSTSAGFCRRRQRIRVVVPRRPLRPGCASAATSSLPLRAGNGDFVAASASGRCASTATPPRPRQPRPLRHLRARERARRGARYDREPPGSRSASAATSSLPLRAERQRFVAASASGT